MPIYDQQRLAARINERPTQNDVGYVSYVGYLPVAKDASVGDKTRGPLRKVDRLGADALLCHG